MDVEKALPGLMGTVGVVGTEANVVYRSLNAAGQVQYVGITNNLLRRAAEHLSSTGIRIEKVMGNLSRSDANAAEQALIDYYGLGRNGGTLLNRINSIAPTRQDFDVLLQRGRDLLRSIGYYQ